MTGVTKKCTVCGKNKPLSEFYKCGKGKNGIQKYNGKCKECYKATNNVVKRYRTCKVCNKDREIGVEISSGTTNTCRVCLDNGLKYCGTCGLVKPIEEFKAAGKIRGKCLKCEGEISTLNKRIKYNTDDEYRLLELNRCHNRYAKKKASGYHTHSEWAKVVNYFGNSCAYCGETHNLTRDHVVPLSRGGTNYIENIVCACPSCNSSKGNKDMVEWYSRQPFYSADRLARIYNWIRGGGINAKQD